MAASATLGPGQLTTLYAILNQSGTYTQNFNVNGTYVFQDGVSGLVNFALQGDSTFSSNKSSGATFSAVVDTAGHAATFQNTGGGTATFTGKITGTGSVVANGPVVLNNTTSDYAGGTTVSGGASVIRNVGGGQLSFAGGTIQINTTGGTDTFSNDISVSGSNNVLQLGGTKSMLFNSYIQDGASSGDLSLAGSGSTFYFYNNANSYTGRTTIGSGVRLAPWQGFIGDYIAGSSGISLQGSTLYLVSDASLNGYSTAGTYTYAQPISLTGSNTMRATGSTVTLSAPITGTGGFTVGSGTIILSSTGNTYSGGTTIASGAHLKGTVSGDTPSIPLSVAVNGTVTGLTWNAGGFLHLTDNNGGTFAGNLAIPTGSTLYYEGGDTGLTLSGVISGARPVVASSGTLRLTGNNTYSGGTQISNGATIRTLAASLPASGGVTLSGGTLAFTDTGASTYSGNIALSSTSTISSSQAVTLSGALTGTGGLTVGGGKVTLSGTSNTYSGTTSIPSGTTFALAHTNSFPTHGNIHIERGTFDLSGITPANGTVSLGSVTTDTGHGTLKVPIDYQGNSTKASLQTQLDLTGLPFSVEVVGMTPPAGAAYTSGSGAPMYTILQNVTGTTDALTLNLSGALSSAVYVGQLSVSGGNLLFTLLGRSPCASPPAAVAAGQTSAQVGTHFAVSNVTSSIMSAVRTEATTGSIGVGSGGPSGGSSGGYGDDGHSFSFGRNPFEVPQMHAVESFHMTEGGMSREVTENRRRFKSLQFTDTTFWAQPLGSIVRQNTMYGNLGMTAKTAGIIFGGDHKVTSDLSVGAGVGYAYTDLRFDVDGGKSRIKEKFVTLFGTWFRDSYHLDVSLVGGLQKYKGHRGITGTLLQANNQHDGHQVTPSVGAGHSFWIGEAEAEIFAGFTYAFSHQSKYQETGAGTSDLSVQGADASMLRSEAGAKISHAYFCENGRLKIGAKLSLVNKMPMQKGNIVTANAGTFETTVKTQNHIAPGLEGSFEWDNGMSTGFSWNGEVGPKFMANEVLITFKQKLGLRRQKM